MNAAKDPEQLRAAKACLSGLLRGRPDTNVENPKYHLEMVEVLAHLSDEDRAILCHPVTGLQTVLKYLPTPADVHGFLRDHKMRREQFAPAPTAYRKLSDESPGPWDQETDYERKRRVVRELLGYDPDKPGIPLKRNLVPPSADDLAGVKLRTPVQPITRQLKEKLMEEGYFDQLRGNHAA